ncbi:hypothetical protein J0H58_23945 [bacterium]|nr:hypothetical protein [bacterium]
MLGRQRGRLIRRAALALGVAGMTAAVLIHRPEAPDIDQAEAYLHAAWAVTNRVEHEANEQQSASRGHKECAAHHEKQVAEYSREPDVEWVEWQRASAYGHTRLATATDSRRRNLVLLSAEYRRRIADANCLILQARDSRDRGVAVKVAPQVQEILRPLLSNR